MKELITNVICVFAGLVAGLSVGWSLGLKLLYDYKRRHK